MPAPGAGARAAGASAAVSGLLLLIPLAVMTGNALVVRNCSIAEGLAFFVLLAPVSAAFGVALGFFSGIHAGASPRPLLLGVRDFLCLQRGAGVLHAGGLLLQLSLRVLSGTHVRRSASPHEDAHPLPPADPFCRRGPPLGGDDYRDGRPRGPSGTPEMVTLALGLLTQGAEESAHWSLPVRWPGSTSSGATWDSNRPPRSSGGRSARSSRPSISSSIILPRHLPPI